jgi:hypothetical protein
MGIKTVRYWSGFHVKNKIIQLLGLSRVSLVIYSTLNTRKITTFMCKGSWCLNDMQSRYKKAVPTEKKYGIKKHKSKVEEYNSFHCRYRHFPMQNLCVNNNIDAFAQK